MAIGWIITGSVVVETVFYWPGIGKYAVDSMMNADFPAVTGYVMFVCTIFLISNLFVDAIYSYIDPRIRLSK
jgi:peptide/nickel transport system permease protein